MDNPIVINLSAGTYDVEVISMSEGGAFDAWSPWNNTTCPDECGLNSGHTGWVNNYTIGSVELGATTYTSGLRYSTAAGANATAIDSSFTLSYAEDAEFYIDDTPISDNAGGISLNVTAVPEPMTVAMLGIGLALLGLRRRSEA